MRSELVTKYCSNSVCSHTSSKFCPRPTEWMESNYPEKRTTIDHQCIRIQCLPYSSLRRRRIRSDYRSYLFCQLKFRFSACEYGRIPWHEAWPNGTPSTVRWTEIEITRLIHSIQTLEIEPIYACLIRTPCSNEDALEAITGFDFDFKFGVDGCWSVRSAVIATSIQLEFDMEIKFVFSERERLPDNVVEDNENRIQSERVWCVCVFRMTFNVHFGSTSHCHFPLVMVPASLSVLARCRHVSVCSGMHATSSEDDKRHPNEWMDLPHEDDDDDVEAERDRVRETAIWQMQSIWKSFSNSSARCLLSCAYTLANE